MSMTSNGLFAAMNRFGFTKEQLLAYSPFYADRTRVECYIPTRTEVYRMAIDELLPVLETWFGRAPEALRPSPQQIRQVIALLRTRHDKTGIAERINDLESRYSPPHA